MQIEVILEFKHLLFVATSPTCPHPPALSKEILCHSQIILRKALTRLAHSGNEEILTSHQVLKVQDVNDFLTAGKELIKGRVEPDSMPLHQSTTEPGPPHCPPAPNHQDTPRLSCGLTDLLQ